MNNDKPLIYQGRNPILSAMAADKTIHRLLVKKGEIEGSLKVIIAKARELGIPIDLVEKSKLDEISETGKHQGVIALCPSHEYTDLATILARSGPPFLVILDKIFDPHNFGAIIRSAAAFGVHGIIIPKRRAVGITPAVLRAAAGAVEHMPVARVANISQTIDALKKRNIWVVGAHTGAGCTPLHKAPLEGPIALVIGNESEGISRLVREKCDFLVNIPMPGGSVSSLNASVACAVALYEINRRKH